MANDRKEEAWELIRKAAEMNGKPLTKDVEMCEVEMQQIYRNMFSIFIWQMTPFFKSYIKIRID